MTPLELTCLIYEQNEARTRTLPLKLQGMQQDKNIAKSFRGSPTISEDDFQRYYTERAE